MRDRGGAKLEAVLPLVCRLRHPTAGSELRAGSESGREASVGLAALRAAREELAEQRRTVRAAADLRRLLRRCCSTIGLPAWRTAVCCVVVCG